MRLPLAPTLLACLLLVAPSYAEEPPPEPGEGTLLDAAFACRVTLGAAMEHAYGSNRRPVRAELVLDTKGRLMARAMVRVVEKEDVSFEEWLGPLNAGGWIPTRQVVTDEAKVAAAADQWSLLQPKRNLLRKALSAAIRTEERAGPADVVLSIAPISKSDQAVISLRVARDGTLRGLVFDPESSTYAVVDPDPEPARVPHEIRTLPAFEVPGGRWFNTEGKAPTLAAWRGQPVLVVITDPG